MPEEAGAVTVKETPVECVADGAVPVTVSVYVPAAAVPALTVSAEDPPAVTLPGFNEAVAPLGTPLTLSETASAEPLVTAVEIVDVPLAPCATVSDAGLAEMEKSFAGGGALTVSAMVVACVAETPVPVTVSVYAPAAAVPAFTVSVDDAPAVTIPGLNEAVAPAGNPLMLNEIDCAEPLVTAVEIVDVPLPPAARVSEEGLAEIEKSSAGGGAFTVSAMLVAWVAADPVPVTVSVYVPAAAEPELTVSVDEPPVVTDVGLTDAVAPGGTPLTVRLIVSALPLTSAVEIVEVPEDPGFSASEFGLAPMEKSFEALVPQFGNLKAPIRVCQLNAPVVAMYSVVYQNVQSSLGSMAIIE
jgi:hypothetical protein